MAHPGFYLNAFVLLLSLVTATTIYTANWQYPVQSGQYFNINDTIVVQWTSNYPTASLFTWYQNTTDAAAYQFSLLTPVPSNYNLSFNLLSETQAFFAQYGQALTYPVQMWFELVWNTSDTQHQSGQNGESFEVFSSSASATTYAASTTFATTQGTATSTLLSSTTTSYTATATTTPDPSASPTQSKAAGSGGLTKGDDAGIAIGVIALVLIALAALWLFCLRPRQKPRNNGQTEPLTGQQPRWRGQHYPADPNIRVGMSPPIGSDPAPEVVPGSIPMNQSRGGPPQELLGRENWRNTAELEAQQRANLMGYQGVHSVDGYHQQHWYSTSGDSREAMRGAGSSMLDNSSSTPTTYYLDSAIPKSPNLGGDQREKFRHLLK